MNDMEALIATVKSLREDVKTLEARLFDLEEGEGNKKISSIADTYAFLIEHYNIALDAMTRLFDRVVAAEVKILAFRQDLDKLIENEVTRHD